MGQGVHDRLYQEHKPSVRVPSSAEIIRLLNEPSLRLGDTPALVGMAHQLMLGLGDQALAELFMEEVDKRRLAASTCGDPFLANYPPRGTLTFDRNDIPLLTLPTGEILGLGATRFMNNVILAGPTGSGKSTLQRCMLAWLVQLGFVVIYFDRKDEARQLLARPELQNLVTVLQLEDLQLVLYQADNGSPPSIVRAATTDLIARWTGRVYAQRLLDEPVLECLAEGKAGEGIPLKILIEKVQKWPVRGFRQAELRESILLALMYINVHLGTLFQYRRSDLLQRLFEKPHLFVMETPTLPADLYGLVVGLIMQWPALQRLHAPRPRPLPVVFVLDDATVAVDAEQDRQSFGGTSPLAEGMFMYRKLLMGVMLATHTVSNTSRKILTNCETLIMTAGRGEDARFLQNVLGVTPEQVEVLRTLQPGHALALVPSKWPRPVLGTFEREPACHVDEAACRATAARFLAGVSSEKAGIAPPATPAKAGPPQTTTVPGASASQQKMPLSDQELRLLLQFTEPLPPSLTESYQRWNLSRVRGAALTHRLETAGLIRLHRFSTGKSGGQLTIAQLTDSAWMLLSQHGPATKPTPPTHGGFEHNLAAIALGRVGAREGFRVDYEVDLSVVRVDARWRHADGRNLYFQIGVSDERREADALTRALTVPVVQQGKLILVTRDAAFAKKVVSLLSGSGVKAANSIECRLLGALIEAAR